jgi:hypothetical protein
MDLVGTIVNAVVVGVVGLILGWMGNNRFKAIERRIDRLEERLDARVDGVDGRIDGLHESLGARIDGLRSDLTQIALAVGARPRAENA